MAAEIRTTATTGNTVVRAAPGMVYGYRFQNTAAQTDNVVVIYDNTTATGTKILNRLTFATAGAAGSDTGLILFPQPVRFSVGVSVGVTGTSPNMVGMLLVD